VAEARAPSPGRSGEGVIVVLLVVLALPVWATAGMPATGAAPSAHGDADVLIPAPELRSRGPPASSVRLARPTVAVPSPVRVDPQFPSASAVPTMCRRPGRTRPILDPTTTTDYNNQSTQRLRRDATGQVTANSVDRRTRESLIAHIGDTERYRKFRPIHAGMWLLHGHVDQLAALVNGLGNLLDVLANAARKTRLRCTGSSGYGSRTTSATRRHRGVGPVGESQCRRPQVANLRPAMTSTSPPSGRASTWPAVAIPATEALFPAPNADSALGSAPSRSDHVSRRTTC
jgi:hypothetical protein